MNGFGHTYLAATSAITYSATTGNLLDPDTAIILAGALAGAGFPDFDMPRTIFYSRRLKIRIRAKIPFVTHRGATHRAWSNFLIVIGTYLLVAAYVFVFAGPAAAGLAIGLLSHAAADMMTPDGVAYLSPLIRRALRILPFRLRVVGDGPPRERANGQVSRCYEAWHRPYRWNGYVAVSQEHALTVLTVLQAAVLYLTLPVTL